MDDVASHAGELVHANTGEATSKVSGLQVMLKQVVLQGSEESVPKLRSTELSRHWDSFRAVYGRPEEECTGDQLTEVDVPLKRDEVPMLILVHVGGTLKTTEEAGAADVHAWTECYKLLCTALLRFKAVTLGPLLDYERMIVEYAARYGDLAWPLLHQCDVRCRLEHKERLRRVLERESVASSARNQAPAVQFNSACPWDSVWTAATEDHKF